MTTALLDANVLVALTMPEHVHHAAARDWFGTGRPFATTAITQGALLRLLLRSGRTASDAWAVLAATESHPDHHWWPDEFGYGRVRIDGIVGHRQVTDAYLATQARHRASRLATFDQGLAALHPDVVDLIAARRH